MRKELWTLQTTALVSLSCFLLFFLVALVSALFYNGPGDNLHLLSTSALGLFLWLTFGLTRQEFSRLSIPGEWLPVLAIAYFAWLATAPSLSPYPYVSTVRAAELGALPLALLAWLIDPGTSGRIFRLVFIQLMLMVGLSLAVWGMVDFLVVRERSHGPFIDPNAYGALINMFLVPAIALYIGNGKWISSATKSALLLAAITVLALALFMSLSRAALIAFLIVFPALMWLAHRNNALLTRAPALVLALLGAYGFVKFGPVDPAGLKVGIEGLLMSPDSYLAHDSSVQARILLWRATWRMIHDADLFTGMGLGTFKSFYPPYRIEGDHSAGNYAHNDYLQVLQEGGLVQFTFLIAFTIVVPAWLLYKNQFSRANVSSGSTLVPGLLLAVLCVSLQAVVNFIHLLVPIAFLTGLYLAVAWEASRPSNAVPLVELALMKIRPAIIKGAIIIMLALHTAPIVADGIIFKGVGNTAPLLAMVSPDDRFAFFNAALALRPENPTPRVMLIRHLIERAEESAPGMRRRKLLEQAEKEAIILSQLAPGYPLVSLLFGSIWAARGTTGDLMIARDYMEAAVRSTPHSTGMRTELVKVYRRLGKHNQAYRVVLEALPWLPNEASASALDRFAAEAEALARHFNDLKQASYWSEIRSQLSRLGHTEH